MGVIITNLFCLARETVSCTASRITLPILLYFIFLYLCPINAQDSEQIKYYTLEDGLSQVSTNDLLLDHSGFVWIATQDGLNKFDGNIFKHYKYNKQDSLTLSGNLINKLLEDNTGKIWVGTVASGLNYYDPERDIFHRIQLTESEKSNEIIAGIEQDDKNNIWVGSRISGLHKLTSTGNSSFAQENFLEEVTITGMLFDAKKNLWVGDTKGNIYKLNPNETESISTKPLVQVRGNVQAFYYAENHLLIGGDYGFHIYDIINKKVRLIELSAANEMVTKHVLAFLKNDESSVWIGTGNGIYLFDWVEQRILKKILYSEDDKNGLSNGTVQALLKISKNQLLVGTANYPNLIDIGEQHFKNISKNLRGEHLLNDNVIFSIFKDEDDLWIGTSDGGLNLIRKSQNYYFKHNQNVIDGFSGTVIRGIVKDEINQRLWLATTRGLNMIDLKTFDPNNPKFFVLQHDPTNKNSINGDFLKDITLDNNNNLWGATYGHGIFRLEFKSKKDYQITRYTNNTTTQNTLKNDFTDCIIVDKENNIWIGTQAGLSSLRFKTDDYQQPEFSNFSKIENDTTTLVHNSVYDILIDKKERMWLGTRNGFSQYLGNGKFNSWTQQEQFSNDVVYSIQDDNDGNLWMGTNEGLVKYNPEKNEFRQFTIEDGIQSNEFDIHTRFKDKNGLIYLGGIGGVTYFNPSDLEKIDLPQKLYFSSLHVKGKAVKIDKKSILKQPLSKTKNIEFKPDEFPFFLQFSSIDYRLNKNVKFGYKLLPTDKEWNLLKDPEIQFLNLPSGTYTLQVNGFSRGKVWDTPPLEMNLVILPSWWSTWWAYLIYISAAFVVANRFYQFQISKKLAIAESDRLKEVNQLKNSLYDNITHEFRTPLTVILGMTDSLENELQANTNPPIHKAIEMIRRNGKSLLSLVNEMLDLSKLESGTMELNLVQTDVIPFVKYLSESFHSLAEAKQINLTVYSEINVLEMDFDANKMASIISNLLSNAIKFTSANGKIIVHLNKIEIKEGDIFSIKVQDNGLGLSEDDMMHLFDRFYQADNQSLRYKEGTGIGLSLVKEFVELMNGTISVESTLGKGSTFTVQLPVSNTAEKKVDPKINVVPSLKKATHFPRAISTDIEENSALPLALIIEDNEDVAHYLKTCLKGKYKTIHAINGNIGVEMAYEKIPDIIISDVMMPGKDGFEVCDVLKSDVRTDHIPIVLLTAKVTTEDRLIGLSHGADAYLAKPFNERELFIRLDQLVLLRKKLVDKIQKDGLTDFLDKRAESPESKFLQKVIQFVNDDIGNSAFGSSDLADKLHLSESQIYRKLKAITDKSTAVFIRSIRLQKAKGMIQTSDKTISEIAYETGFNDPSWFSRAFKEEFGAAPSDINK